MSNPNENRINTTLSATKVTNIDSGFASINTELDGTAQALTEQERDNLFSIAEENEAFATDALAQGLLLKSKFPSELQLVVDNLKTDTTLSGQMNTILDSRVMPLLLRVKDTKRLADHERYVASLAIYKMIEAGAALGLEGFQAAYDILKVRFARQGGGNTPQPNP